MKRFIRLIAAAAMLLLLISLLAGCKPKEYAISVSGQEVSETDYYRTALMLKNHYIAGLGEEESPAFWAAELDDGSTRAQSFTAYLNDYLADNKLYIVEFERLGLSLDPALEETISSAIEEAVEGNGGMTKFNELLEKNHYTYEDYVNEVYDNAKKSLVLKHYFGEKGQKPTPLADIKAYYNKHNARIKYIFLSKLDEDTQKPLGEEELAKLEAKAKEALTSAQRESKTDLFDELISIHSEDTTSLGNGVTFSDQSEMDETFSKAVFEMNFGEVIHLETDEAHWVIKRYNGADDAFFDADLQQKTLEQLRADEITELMEEWRSNAKIKVNKAITRKYRPELLMAAAAE